MDISKSTFCVAYRSGTTMKTRTWEYTQEQMNEFAESLDSDSMVVMEATGVYHTRLAACLHSRGLMVSVVNPLSVKNFARMLMRRTKTDKADSKLLVEYGETMELCQWEPKETWCVEVQQIYSLLESRNKELAMAINHMESLNHSQIASEVCLKMVKDDIERLKRDIESLEEEIVRLVE